MAKFHHHTRPHRGERHHSRGNQSHDRDTAGTGRQEEQESPRLPPVPRSERLAHSRRSNEEIFRDASRSLPQGIDLLRPLRYTLPLEGGELDLAVFRLYVPPEKEKDLRDWLGEFSRRNRIEVFIERVRVYQGIKEQIAKLAGPDHILTDKELPEIKDLLRTMHGEPPRLDARAGKHIVGSGVPDLRKIPFITIDSASTRDREDAVWAAYNRDGTMTLKVAFADITWFSKPGDSFDAYARKLGQSVYGLGTVVSTLGPELSNEWCSLMPGKPRMAWVCSLKIMRDGSVVSEGPPERSIISVSRHYTPEEASRLARVDDPEADGELKVCGEATARIRAGRRKSQNFYRIKGITAGHDLVAESMIAGKQFIGSFLAAHDHGTGIFKVHAPPGEALKKRFADRLRAMGIDADSDTFDTPYRFAEMFRALQQRVFREQTGEIPAGSAAFLANAIITAFLTRTRFETENLGHHALRVDAYAEIKARDHAGMTNQYVLRTITDPAWADLKLSSADIEARTRDRNRTLQERDWLGYRLRFLEMLGEKLDLTGRELTGNVIRTGDGRVYVDVPQFGRWGLIDKPPADIAARSRISVSLIGFDVDRMRFRFAFLGKIAGRREK